MKIIINARHSGFGIPVQIQEMYLKKKGIEHYWYQQKNIRLGEEDFVRKDFDEFNTSLIFQPIAHLRNLGEKYSIFYGDEGTETSLMRWDATAIRFSDSTKTNETEYGLIIDGRQDPILIEIVEALSSEDRERMRSIYNPRVVEIPDDVEWTIENYDGYEWVAEKHRTWGAGE